MENIADLKKEIEELRQQTQSLRHERLSDEMSDEDYRALRFRMYMWSHEADVHDQIRAVYGDKYTLAQAKESGLSKTDPASFQIPTSTPRSHG